MLRILRLFLLPFNLLYALIVFVRNQCYDRKYFKSYQFDIPVICIGNLVLGGSGKTPTTEYLVRLLKDYKVAILSRGYGRKTKGYILANQNATTDTIGDEPMQYYSKFHQITVAVCEDRIKGIEQLQSNHDIILLDDAFQHRRVNAGLNILLFEQEKLQQLQFLLPAGNMREPYSATQRAQIILITKTKDDFGVKELQRIEQKLSVQKNQLLASSFLQYQKLKSVYENQSLINQDKVKTIFLLTGIANTNPLKKHLESNFSELILHQYADHHQFTPTEIITLVNDFDGHPSKNKIIVTTEKDRQRLLSAEIKELLLNLPIYYLPISFEMREECKSEFDHKILDYVTSFRRIN